MGKAQVIHSEEYEYDGTEFRIEVFQSSFGQTTGRYGYRAHWIRLRDQARGGSDSFSGTLEDAVLAAQLHAAQNK
jgi:hypothetical protein